MIPNYASKINKASEIIGFVLILCLWYLICWVINKFVLKKSKKNIIKVLIITWLIVLIINTFAVVTNIPFVIGVPISTCACGHASKYASLGYMVIDEGDMHSIENTYHSIKFRLF